MKDMNEAGDRKQVGKCMGGSPVVDGCRMEEREEGKKSYG